MSLTQKEKRLQDESDARLAEALVRLGVMEEAEEDAPPPEPKPEPKKVKVIRPAAKPAKARR